MHHFDAGAQTATRLCQFVGLTSLTKCCLDGSDRADRRSSVAKRATSWSSSASNTSAGFNTTLAWTNHSATEQPRNTIATRFRFARLATEPKGATTRTIEKKRGPDYMVV
jgi:hypothetical protein